MQQRSENVRLIIAGIVVVADRRNDRRRQSPVFRQPGADFRMVDAEVLAPGGDDAAGRGEGGSRRRARPLFNWGIG